LLKLFSKLSKRIKTEINLPEQTITLLATGTKESFDINGYKKKYMLNGFDDIDYLQNIKRKLLNLPMPFLTKKIQV
jgi:3-isopropylmalate/(R)-2-methylmalate dehydratase small subunit